MPTKREARTRKQIARRKRGKWFLIGFGVTLIVGGILIILVWSGHL